MRKLSHEEIIARQAASQRAAPLPFCVVLNNIRSLYNVGSIFRTSDGVGVEKIWLCGITGFPPQSQIAKTALGAEERVTWEHREQILPLLDELKEKGHQIVVLEQTDQSVDYQDFYPRRPVCLVVGNEIEGVSDEVVRRADAAVEIDMAGIKNSLNVGVAFGAVAYYIRHCFKRESGMLTSGRQIRKERLE